MFVSFAQKTTTSAYVFSSTTKGCETSCSAGGGTFAGVGANIYCCSTELCNGANVQHVSLILAVMTSFMAVWISL